jgi:hypothetical protein
MVACHLPIAYNCLGANKAITCRAIYFEVPLLGVQRSKLSAAFSLSDSVYLIGGYTL